MWKLNTPVAFITFNRPQVTERVFSRIRQMRPPKLFLISDGPRLGRADDVDLVKTTRAIVQDVDWDCEVFVNFSEINLGCRKRVSSGIDWVFENVEAAIILEDDCLPTPDFFQFCEEMLEFYKNQTNVGMISGDNFQFNKTIESNSYYFSRYCHIWGWATWRRAWQKYDVSMSDWPQLRAENWLEKILISPSSARHWKKSFDEVYENCLDTWDHQWSFACWKNNMLAVMPNVNLISNIGFGDGATHTKGNSIYSNMTTGIFRFPVDHPDAIKINIDADIYTEKNMFTSSLGRRIYRRLILPYIHKFLI